MNALAGQAEVLHQWQGHFLDLSQRIEPACGRILTCQADFERAGRTWRAEEPLPGIDFSSHFVLAYTGDGPNGFHIHLSGPDESGDLRVEVMVTERYGPGFCYLLAVLSRAGIRSINGQPLILA
jgi:hypothetical protein